MNGNILPLMVREMLLTLIHFKREGQRSGSSNSLSSLWYHTEDSNLSSGTLIFLSSIFL